MRRRSQPDILLLGTARVALTALFFGLLVVGSAGAQVRPGAKNIRVDPVTGALEAIYRPQFEKPIDGSPDEVARAFLRSEPRIGWDGSPEHLRLESARESAGGTHLTYRQYLGDLPVVRAVTKVSLNRDSEPTFVANNFAGDLDPGVARRPLVERTRSEAIAAEAVEGGDARVAEASLAILPGEPTRLVWKTIVWPETGGEWIVLVDAITGEIAELTDITLHRSTRPRERRQGRMIGYMDFASTASQRGAGVAATGRGMVFDPDPLATSGMPYAPPYTDADDAEIAELNAERKSVDLLDISQFADNRYRLAGPHVEIVGRRPVGIANYEPPSELDPNAFNYTRGDERFEGVMAYYHVDRSQRRIQELGYHNIQNTPLPVNPFGEGDADNSNYYLALNFVALGGGGIDDAEDAFVIWHEYGHALLNANVPDFISTTEGRSIHEGWSDYWAASYQRAQFESGELPAGDWKRLFRWDGNYEGWFGRQMPDFRSYPDDLTGNFYTNGLIVASAFMAVWDRLGPDLTDQLVVQGQFYLTNSSIIPDYAEAVIQADIDLYGGAHARDLVEAFAERGLVDSEDYGPVLTHEPLGDTEQLGGSIEVTAQIVGIIAPIQSVVLAYDVSGQEATVDMTDTGGGSYVAQIPLPASPALVEYYIVATDGQGQEVRFPADAPDEVIRFQAGPDADPPVIDHAPIPQISALGWPPEVNATIEDNIGVDSAYVDYTIDDLDSGSRIDEGRFALLGAGSLYTGLFPRLDGQIDGNELVTYRIVANDYSVAANKASLPPEVDPAFEFLVSERGIVSSLDFESASDDITVTGAWELGTPAFGVTYAHSGESAWATRLDRAYPDFPGTAELILPPFNLAGLQTAWLEFWHWYDIEHDGRAEPASDTDATLWDGGIVQVSTNGGSSWISVTPEGGYDGTIAAGAGNPLQSEPAFGGYSFGWRRELVQIPAGPEVMIRFVFGHDISNEEESIRFAGWIIDDVAIRVDRPGDTEAPVVLEAPPPLIEAEAGSPIGPGVTVVATDDVGIASVIGTWVLSGSGSPTQGTFRLAQTATDPLRFAGRIPVGEAATAPGSVVTYNLEVTDFGGNTVELPSQGEAYRVEYVFVARENQLLSVTPSGGWEADAEQWLLSSDTYSGGMAALVLTPVDLPSDAADIRFEMAHDYRIGDGTLAVVEVSGDGGFAWTALDPADGFGEGQDGFSGQANDAYSVFDLNEFSGRQVHLRIGASTTELAEGDFWRIRSASTVFKAEDDRFTINRPLVLHPNFPNPFTATTTFSFTVPAEGRVSLTVYDALGRLVETITDQTMDAGSYSKIWDAGDVAAGIYFVKLTTVSGQDVKAVSIIR